MTSSDFAEEGAANDDSSNLGTVLGATGAGVAGAGGAAAGGKY